MYCAMSCSWQTASCTRLATSGRAIAFGTGVTSADPEGRQPRTQRPHRDQPPPAQPGDARVPMHHLRVRDDVRPADVERPVHVEREHHRGGDQVAQHVPDRDRLDPVADPPRRDHDRQPLGEVAQHLERRRAGPDDDRRAQHDGRHAAVQQDAADLLAGAQVRRGAARAAEVDDALHAGRSGRLGELFRGAPVDVLEPALAERVDQVVHHLDPVTGGLEPVAG